MKKIIVVLTLVVLVLAGAKGAPPTVADTDTIEDCIWRNCGDCDGVCPSNQRVQCRRCDGGNVEKRCAVDATCADRDPSEAISACKADMAERLGMTSDQIELVGTPEFYEWSDASCGCPEAGHMYVQVITPGWKIFLRGEGGWVFEYHTGEPRWGSPRIIRLCRRISTWIYLPLISRP